MTSGDQSIKARGEQGVGGTPLAGNSRARRIVEMQDLNPFREVKFTIAARGSKGFEPALTGSCAANLVDSVANLVEA